MYTIVPKVSIRYDGMTPKECNTSKYLYNDVLKYNSVLINRRFCGTAAGYNS